jgi:hypothetical protein
LIRRSSYKRGDRSRVQREKTRNAQMRCQTRRSKEARFSSASHQMHTDVVDFAKLWSACESPRRFREMPALEAGNLKRMSFSRSSGFVLKAMRGRIALPKHFV